MSKKYTYNMISSDSSHRRYECDGIYNTDVDTGEKSLIVAIMLIGESEGSIQEVSNEEDDSKVSKVSNEDQDLLVSKD